MYFFFSSLHSASPLQKETSWKFPFEGESIKQTRAWIWLPVELFLWGERVGRMKRLRERDIKHSVLAFALPLLLSPNPLRPSDRLRKHCKHWLQRAGMRLSEGNIMQEPYTLLTGLHIPWLYKTWCRKSQEIRCRWKESRKHLIGKRHSEPLRGFETSFYAEWNTVCPHPSRIITRKLLSYTHL